MMLHVAGRITENVAGFLAPSIGYLNRHGVAQHLLMLDDLAHPRALGAIPPDVGVTRVGVASGGLVPWIALRFALRRIALAHSEVSTVHFHGLRPWMLGMLESNSWAATPVTFVSPHGSRLLPLLPWLAATRHGRFETSEVDAARAAGSAILIATSDFEARRMRDWGFVARDTNPVVDTVFFEDVAPSVGAPVIVAGAYTPSRAGAESVVRLAVILSDVAHGLRFDWLGPSFKNSREQLEATGCRVLPADSARAVRDVLAGARVFVAATPDPHLPLLLAQAMAVGCACVVIDTPAHVDLVQHDRTGLVVADEWALAHSVSRLLDDAALRQRLGRAARAEAQSRFSAEGFARGAVDNYGAWPWRGRHLKAPAPALATHEAAALPDPELRR